MPLCQTWSAAKFTVKQFTNSYLRSHSANATNINLYCQYINWNASAKVKLSLTHCSNRFSETVMNRLPLTYWFILLSIQWI